MTTPIPRAAVLEILRTPQSSDTFPDMIRRVEALEECGVRVKALEWEIGATFGRHYAKSAVGQYLIRDYGDSEIWISLGDKTVGKWHETLEAAKATAQADYTSRIHAALDGDGND